MTAITASPIDSENCRMMRQSSGLNFCRDINEPAFLLCTKPAVKGHARCFRQGYIGGIIIGKHDQKSGAITNGGGHSMH